MMQGAKFDFNECSHRWGGLAYGISHSSPGSEEDLLPAFSGHGVVWRKSRPSGSLLGWRGRGAALALLH